MIIWGSSANLSAITAANAGGEFGNFYGTFYGMLSLNGAAQTFINTKLGGIIPAEKAQTFSYTGVSDFDSLSDYWTEDVSPPVDP